MSSENDFYASDRNRYQPPPRQPMIGSLLLLLLIPLLALTGFVVWRYWPSRDAGLDPNAQPRAVTPRGSLAEAEEANIKIYDLASPSLVQVTNLAQKRDLFGLSVEDVPTGVGSGFVWDDSGYVVTNYHVVQGASAAQVTLANHASYTTTKIWGYPDQDIAVLKISAPKKDLHPVLVGSSHDLKVGQIVYTLGDPFGLDQTMSTGIVSALGRQMKSVNGKVIRGVIQTSAPINPGNSGGPLLDSAGRLIGMNTAIISPSGAFAGIGFAIPVDEINQIVPQLIQHGKITRPRLGIQPAPDHIARKVGVKQGVLILKVLPDGPSAAAGLRGVQRDEQGDIHLGDIIVAVGGKTVNSTNDLYDALRAHKPGETVTVTVQRGDERKDVQVTLEAGE